MNGQVLEIAPSDSAACVKALRAARQSGRLPLREIELYGSLVHIVAPEINTRQRQIAAILREHNIQIEQMSIVPPSLEDVFIACMR